jgi:aurora kinase
MKCVKISDFGWSIEMNKKERDTLCGTLEYLSPEMVKGESNLSYII